MNTATLLKVIGGQSAIAKECHVTDSAVSLWVREDRIPTARQQYLRLAHPGSHWDEYEARTPQRTEEPDPKAA